MILTVNEWLWKKTFVFGLFVDSSSEIFFDEIPFSWIAGDISSERFRFVRIGWSDDLAGLVTVFDSPIR